LTRSPTVKKSLVILAALAAAASIGAQSLKDNSYYQQSLELIALSQAAFDEGDYDAAAEYAAQAGEYAILSDEYVDKMLAITRADAAIDQARDKIARAGERGAEAANPGQYALALAEMEAARDAYDDEDYMNAEIRANSASESIDAIDLAAFEDAALPAAYVVRLFPGDRECLWKIAEYPFIYNDASKWPIIYERNKKSFVDPANPNLIEPGQELVIPSIAGEARMGSYDPSRKYRPFSAPKE